MGIWSLDEKGKNILSSIGLPLKDDPTCWRIKPNFAGADTFSQKEYEHIFVNICQNAATNKQEILDRPPVHL